MEQIEKIRAKLLMLGTLPQPEYVSVARNILDDLKGIEDKIGEYMDKLRVDNDNKFFDMLDKAVKSPVVYKFGSNTEYEVTVKVTTKPPQK